MKLFNRWAISALLLAAMGFSSVTNAALVSRLGGLAYYDDVADLTWLADANAAGTTMNWADANAWAGSLIVGGVGGWRLPDTDPVDGVAFNTTWTTDGSTDKSYNISVPGTVYAGSTASEMSHMFYNTLGNTGQFDTSGAVTGCTSCLTNSGPFSNVQSDAYWSATDAPYDSYAWLFAFNIGYQGTYSNSLNYYAWAVHNGDVSAVPVPAAVWLFGSGLLGLVGISKRKKTVS